MGIVSFFCPSHISVGRKKEFFRRKNGFQCPLDLFQIASWILMIYLPVAFAVFSAGVFHMPTIVVVNVFYWFFMFLTILSDIIAIGTDPTDPSSRILVSDVDLLGLPPEGKNPCIHCKAFVDVTSKHCRQCDRCVVGFDHHCKWLNNCVGDNNYRSFFLFSVFVFITLAIHVGTVIYQLAASFSDESLRNKVLSIYPSWSIGGWRAAIIVSGIVALVVLIPIGHLIVFHLAMAYRGETTYAWIIARRKRKKPGSANLALASKEVPLRRFPSATAYQSNSIPSGGLNFEGLPVGGNSGTAGTDTTLPLSARSSAKYDYNGSTRKVVSYEGPLPDPTADTPPAPLAGMETPPFAEMLPALPTPEPNRVRSRPVINNGSSAGATTANSTADSKKPKISIPGDMVQSSSSTLISPALSLGMDGAFDPTRPTPSNTPMSNDGTVGVV